MYKIVITER